MPLLISYVKEFDPEDQDPICPNCDDVPVNYWDRFPKTKSFCDVVYFASTHDGEKAMIEHICDSLKTYLQHCGQHHFIIDIENWNEFYKYGHQVFEQFNFDFDEESLITCLPDVGNYEAASRIWKLVDDENKRRLMNETKELEEFISIIDGLAD